MMLIFVVWFITETALPRPQSIAWKHRQSVDISSMTTPEMSLQEAIRQIIDHHAENPQNVLIDSSVSGHFSVPRMTASSIDVAFEWILARFALSTIYKNEHWLILPKKEVWHQIPYHKLILSPISLDKILEDISHVGQITIIFNQEQAKRHVIQKNLLYPTVETGINELLRQFGWIADYDATFHTLYLTEKKEIETRSIFLKNVKDTEVKQFFQKNPFLFEGIPAVQYFFPTKNLIILKGKKELLDSISSAIAGFDHTPPVEDFHFETIILTTPPHQIEPHLQSIFRQNKNLKSQLIIHWEKTAEPTPSSASIVSLYGEKANVQKMINIIKKLDETYQKSQPLVIKRMDFKYLDVETKKILSEGQVFTIPGVEAKLRQFFQQHVGDQEKRTLGMRSLQIIPDFVNNSVILRGKREQVSLAKEILKTWDTPQALIKIEAHIFETSDTVSRELGTQFSAQGIAEGNEIPNVNDAGEFTASAILGPLQTTKAFQVDTLLRFIETEGKGKVLSRPSVVTTNNIEAEMRSGDIINVKVVIDDKPTLKEIKTGVALRVTPRLITETEDNLSEYKIRLNVFAESSNQINQTTEGIPQINSQTARGEVVVRNGEPFLLGGLIRSNRNESESGVPLLKDIPLLGNLFKIETDSNRFNHILVFVTPTLLSSEEKQKLPNMPELENHPFK